MQIVQAGKVKAQVPYFVKRSFVSIPKAVKAGHPFIVEIKGVGWTQMDNTVAVTYDNATSDTPAASTPTATCASSCSRRASPVPT